MSRGARIVACVLSVVVAVAAAACGARLARLTTPVDPGGALSSAPAASIPAGVAISGREAARAELGRFAGVLGWVSRSCVVLAAGTALAAALPVTGRFVPPAAAIAALGVAAVSAIGAYATIAYGAFVAEVAFWLAIVAAVAAAVPLALTYGRWLNVRTGRALIAAGDVRAGVALAASGDRRVMADRKDAARELCKVAEGGGTENPAGVLAARLRLPLPARVDRGAR